MVITFLTEAHALQALTSAGLPKARARTQMSMHWDDFWVMETPALYRQLMFQVRHSLI